MGTNYYGRPIPDENTIQKMHEAIDKRDFNTLLDLIPERIHIGKSSMGWHFLLNHHHWKYYGKEPGEFEKWLKDLSIVDEYGDPETADGLLEWIKIKAGKSKPDLQYGFMHNGYNFSNYTEFS